MLTYINPTGGNFVNEDGVDLRVLTSLKTKNKVVVKFDDKVIIFYLEDDPRYFSVISGDVREFKILPFHEQQNIVRMLMETTIPKCEVFLRLLLIITKTEKSMISLIPLAPNKLTNSLVSRVILNKLTLNELTVIYNNDSKFKESFNEGLMGCKKRADSGSFEIVSKFFTKIFGETSWRKYFNPFNISKGFDIQKYFDFELKKYFFELSQDICIFKRIIKHNYDPKWLKDIKKKLGLTDIPFNESGFLSKSRNRYYNTYVKAFKNEEFKKIESVMSILKEIFMRFIPKGFSHLFFMYPKITESTTENTKDILRNLEYYSLSKNFNHICVKNILQFLSAMLFLSIWSIRTVETPETGYIGSIGKQGIEPIDTIKNLRNIYFKLLEKIKLKGNREKIKDHFFKFFERLAVYPELETHIIIEEIRNEFKTGDKPGKSSDKEYLIPTEIISEIHKTKYVIGTETDHMIKGYITGESDGSNYVSFLYLKKV